MGRGKGIFALTGIRSKKIGIGGNTYVKCTRGYKKQRKERTFKRSEMVAYLQKKLTAAKPGITFTGMKHNILTCQYKGETKTIYLSTSRDYEPLRSADVRDPQRGSAWHKGTASIFSSCDYYALLVKVDTGTNYEMIEGMLLNQEELNQWLEKKVKVPSGMINLYVHYRQDSAKGRTAIMVSDEREQPGLPLNHPFDKAFELEGQPVQP